MCLITYTPDKNLLDMEKLEVAMDNNPHGFGLAYAQDGELFYAKKMEGWEYFKALLNMVPAGVPLGIHFRWATQGEKSLLNAHPFPLASIGAGHRMDLCVMHNGTINNGIGSWRTNDPNSDTHKYVVKTLRPILSKNPEVAFEPAFMEMVERDIGRNNKLLFLAGDGRVAFAHKSQGDVLKETPEIWYSNKYSFEESYRGKKTTHTTTHTHTGGNQQAEGWRNRLHTWTGGASIHIELPDDATLEDKTHMPAELKNMLGNNENLLKRSEQGPTALRGFGWVHNGNALTFNMSVAIAHRRWDDFKKSVSDTVLNFVNGEASSSSNQNTNVINIKSDVANASSEVPEAHKDETLMSEALRRARESLDEMDRKLDAIDFRRMNEAEIMGWINSYPQEAANWMSKNGFFASAKQIKEALDLNLIGFNEIASDFIYHKVRNKHFVAPVEVYSKYNLNELAS